MTIGTRLRQNKQQTETLRYIWRGGVIGIVYYDCLLDFSVEHLGPLWSMRGTEKEVVVDRLLRKKG